MELQTQRSVRKNDTICPRIYLSDKLKQFEAENLFWGRKSVLWFCECDSCLLQVLVTMVTKCIRICTEQARQWNLDLSLLKYIYIHTHTHSLYTHIYLFSCTPSLSVSQSFYSPLPTAWTYGGAAPRIWKQSAPGQSGILIILKRNHGEEKAWF